MSYDDLEIKSKSIFLKVEAGQPHDLRILNETPAEIMRHTTGKVVMDCKGDDCAMCADGDEPSQRFMTNVYDYEAHKVMLWEFGTMVGRQLKAIATSLKEENKDITEVDLRVEATGSGLQKKYMISPRMTTKQLPEGLKLLKLGKKEDNDIPF